MPEKKYAPITPRQAEVVTSLQDFVEQHVKPIIRAALKTAKQYGLPPHAAIQGVGVELIRLAYDMAAFETLGKFPPNDERGLSAGIKAAMQAWETMARTMDPEYEPAIRLGPPPADSEVKS